MLRRASLGGGGAALTLGGRGPSVGLDVGNVFSVAYFDHVNRYRLIDLPEQGRDVALWAELPIQL